MNLVTSHDLDCFKYRLPMYVSAPKSNSPQTVVVHNLGCIRNIQPQKQNFVPQVFRDVQAFKYTDVRGFFREYIRKLISAAVFELFFLGLD